MKSKFSIKVLRIVSKIPKGRTLSYADVAKRCGNPLASRAVGNILHANHDRKIPCHRVIRSSGQIGGYNRGERMKMKLLKQEKIGK